MRQIEYFKTRLVSRPCGTLPAVLTCPHGGDEVPAGVPERTRDGGQPSRFIRSRRAISAGVGGSMAWSPVTTSPARW
jgi:hypothetical protein